MKIIERILAYLLFIIIISLSYISFQLYGQVKDLNHKLDSVVLELNVIDILRGHYIINLNPEELNRFNEKIWM